jgi:hypothetical protein
MKTRNESINWFIGQPSILSMNQLPTYGDIYSAYLYQTTMKNCNKDEAVDIVAHKVKEIYTRGSIPTIQIKSIVTSINRFLDKIREATKNKVAREKQKDKLKILFNISPCKCFQPGKINRSDCICPREKKITKDEWDFWVDQNTDRQMVIANVDMDKTIKLQRRDKRKLKLECPVAKKTKKISNILVDEDNGDMDDHDVTSNDYQNDVKAENNNRNTNEYPELCKAMDRCKISNRDACLILNAMLKDMNLLTPRNAIDHSKLYRQRTKMRKKAIKNHEKNMNKLICIGFDGKRNNTLVKNRGIRRTVKEEHYIIVAFPQGKYVDHLIPDSGKACDVSKEILKTITNTGSMDSLRAVLCDGTVNNTGKFGGITRKIEHGIGRPLQWLICLLHTNELPLRQYISVLGGGSTTGPSSSTNAILSKIEFNAETLPILNFKVMPGKVKVVSNDFLKTLSTDQSYLYKACLAVQNGCENLDHKNYLQTATPGSVHNARWVTTANRILRLYMSEKKPSKSLRRIVYFIVNAYAPSWFHIKQHSSCFDGAKNFFFMMKLCYELGPNDWNIVEKVFKNNSYFAHPENILLAAIDDTNEDNRLFAYHKILEARNFKDADPIRIFDKDIIKIKPNATNYTDMITWKLPNYYSPPLLSSVSNDELLTYSFDSVRNIPCHSQAVERSVQDISSTTSKVIGHAARHGMAIQTAISREDKPKLNTKSNFL